MSGAPWLTASLLLKKKRIILMEDEKKERIDTLATKIYELVNDRYSVPEIAEKLLGKGDHSKVGSKQFFEVCDAVDKLISEGLVYFRDSDGVLLDLQR